MIWSISILSLKIDEVFNFAEAFLIVKSLPGNSLFWICRFLILALPPRYPILKLSILISLPNEFDKFSEYQFSVDNLEQFSGFTIKIVMISTNESYPVRLKDFRAIALAWYQLKDIKIFFVMKKQVP